MKYSLSSGHVKEVFNTNMEAETKWVQFHRQHFQMHYLEWKCLNSDKTSLRFLPKALINSIPALVQIMAWCWPGNKPESMIVCSLTHIYITQPQWVKKVERYDDDLYTNDEQRLIFIECLLQLPFTSCCCDLWSRAPVGDATVGGPCWLDTWNMERKI